MRIAATADLHCRVQTTTLVRDLLGPAVDRVDALVLAGDLTDTGLPEEAICLGKQLEKIDLPVVAVLGNHDHESGKASEVADCLIHYGVRILNGQAVELDGVGFAGSKGFGGGFGSRLIQPFGEQEIKDFILTGIEEAAKLQRSLENLGSKHRLVVLHYAPVPDTLAGEPLELYPFLGSSRFAEAVDRCGADLIVHGHAHHGSPQGRTLANIPVYNVSRYVLARETNLPYCLIEMDGDR